MQDMLSIGPDFTPLERAVLSNICEMHPEDQIALEAQLSTATLASRENTGGGFFTNFEVDRISNTVVEGERLRNGPAAKIVGLEHGMGFILWLEEGYAKCLEGYSYESTTAIVFDVVAFEIVQDQDEAAG